MDPETTIQKIAAINTNSIGTIKRRYHLQKFIEVNHLDICLISETKLNPKHKVELSNHHLIRTDIPNSRQGGDTAIAIHKKFKYTTIQHPNSSNNKIIESTVIKIKMNSQITFLIVSIYANHDQTNILMKELNKLADDLKLANDNNYYLIADDLNAKNTNCLDTSTNTRGRHLAQWIENNGITYKAALLLPSKPTFPRSSSYLDYCILDLRLEVIDLVDGKLQTLSYDSDHNAIVLTLNLNHYKPELQADKDPTYNFKKAN